MMTWKASLPDYEWLIYKIWYLDVPAKEDSFCPPLLIPNPRAHLIITPENQDYHYHGKEMNFRGTGSHLLSAIDSTIRLEDHAPLRRLGITFQPSALYQLHGYSGVRINQCTPHPGEQILIPDAYSNPEHCFISREQTLTKIRRHLDTLQLQPRTDAFIDLTDKAMQALELDSNQTISELTEKCHSSRRTLERAFKRVTGLTIKQYQMMIRLEQMVLTLYQQQTVDWAAMAQSFGFSDQPHLIRYLRQILGQTPARYSDNRNLTIDIYGDFE